MRSAHALGFEFGCDFVGGFAAHEGWAKTLASRISWVAAQVAAFFREAMRSIGVMWPGAAVGRRR